MDAFGSVTSAENLAVAAVIASTSLEVNVMRPPWIKVSENTKGAIMRKHMYPNLPLGKCFKRETSDDAL